MLIEPLTIREASVLTDLPLTAVNRSIDENKLTIGVLRGHRERRLTWDGVLALAFDSEIKRTVTPTYWGQCASQFQTWFHNVRTTNWDEALEAELGGQPQTNKWPDLVLYLEGAVRLVVEVRAVTHKVAWNRYRLNSALSQVVEDPDIQAGAPTFRGTRILVWPVLEALDRGVPEQEIFEDYPALTPKAIEAARLYASVRPPRGRPKAAKSGEPKFVRRYRAQ